MVCNRTFRNSGLLSRARGRNFSSFSNPEEKRQHQANEERVASKRDRKLSRLRTEKVERSMADMYETGAMRRVWLRGADNVRKRLLIHACGYNLGVLMRALTDQCKSRVSGIGPALGPLTPYPLIY